jgi:beta-lactamase class A
MRILPANRRRAPSVAAAALAACLALAPAAGAPDCTPPGSGDWTVSQDCDLTQSAALLGDVIVENGATLTVLPGRYLSVDFTTSRLVVRQGSRLIVKDGARLFVHPIHYQIASNTDGAFGYYVKRVGGPVLDAFQHTSVFYPSSTIKALEHLHAMRALEAQQGLSLDGTFLNVCPSTATTNCTDSPDSMMTCNNGSFCSAAGAGAAPNVISLRTALLRMLVPSNNEAANSLQEFFGNGTPSVGRTAMNQTAANVIGMSASSQLNHKFACCTVLNNPANQLTLADIALLYEQAISNPAVLQSDVAFHDHLQNETGGMTCGDTDGDNTDDCVGHQDFFVSAAIQQEGAAAGLTPAEIQAFSGLVRMAHKAGSNTPADDLNNYVSLAGWIELPIDGGASRRRYVYGLYIVNATIFTPPSIRMLATDLLRDVIRDAAEAF